MFDEQWMVLVDIKFKINVVSLTKYYIHRIRDLWMGRFHRVLSALLTRAKINVSRMDPKWRSGRLDCYACRAFKGYTTKIYYNSLCDFVRFLLVISSHIYTVLFRIIIFTHAERSIYFE